MCGNHMDLKKRVDSLEKQVDELTEILYNMLGVKKDDLQPLSATKIADEAWHKCFEEFPRTNTISPKELEKE